MKHHERIVRLGMRVESLRHQDVRTQEDVAAPKTRQQLAADTDVLYKLGVGLRFNGSDLLIETQRRPGWMRRINMQLDGR